MQHEGPINQADPAFFDTPVLQDSFQCATGGQNIRNLLTTIIGQIDARCHGADDLARNAEIVLAEVLNNIEEHGYEGRAGGQIKLDLKVFDDRITVQTTDFGQPMPGLQLPVQSLPDANGACEDLPEGGFGWFLIHTLAPEPDYKRRGRTNILNFTIRNL